MSSQGPYGRQGYQANPQGYGGGYGGSGAYTAPPYGQGVATSYAAPAPQAGTYGMGGGIDVGGLGVNTAGDYENDKSTSKAGKKSIALQALNQNVLLWAGFFTASLLVYFMISGRDFSFLMTYGAMARMFGFGILNVKTFKSQRASGVSVKSLQLYSLVFFFRLTSIFRHEGYLPYDKSGDWLYHFIEGMSLLFTSTALYGCMMPFKGTYQRDLDQFGEFNVPSGFGAAYLAGPILLVAIFIHPNLNADFLSDVAWTYAMYLESTALIPQLYMFQKQASGVVELLTAHFVAALGFGRLMEFLFWIYSYHELASSTGSRLPGYLALFSQFVQLVLMIDFFWYYYKAVRSATPQDRKSVV